MARKIRGEPDEDLQKVMHALAVYEARHPKAVIEAVREDKYSIRVRVIDPDFKGVGRHIRHKRVWQMFEGLPGEVVSQVAWLLCVTPREAKTSLASMEFDDAVAASS